MKHITLFLFLLFTVQITVAQSQGYNKRNTKETSMVLQGRVVTENGTPITGVNIEGALGSYATTDARGYFKLPANMGDEVTISGVGFETVYYRIRSLDDLEIKVQSTKQDTKKLSTLSYQVAMDSAQLYLKKDAQKTADFLIAALSNNPKSLSKNHEGAAYEKLGDLSTFTKQYAP